MCTACVMHFPEMSEKMELAAHKQTPVKATESDCSMIPMGKHKQIDSLKQALDLEDKISSPMIANCAKSFHGAFSSPWIHFLDTNP